MVFTDCDGVKSRLIYGWADVNNLRPVNALHLVYIRCDRLADIGIGGNGGRTTGCARGHPPQRARFSRQKSAVDHVIVKLIFETGADDYRLVSRDGVKPSNVYVAKRRIQRNYERYL